MNHSDGDDDYIDYSALEIGDSNLKTIAYSELGETVERLAYTIIQIRKEINGFSTEEYGIIDKSQVNLTRFIRLSKYNYDETVSRIKLYYKFYHHNSVILNEIEDKKQHSFKQFNRIIQIIKNCDDKLHVLVVLRPEYAITAFHDNLFNANNRHIILQFNVWMFNELSKDIDIQICGMIIINTFKNLNFYDQSRLFSITPIPDTLHIFQFIQILGLRLAAVHIYEPPALMSIIWNLAKPFMTQKMQSRFHLEGKHYDNIKGYVLEHLIPHDLITGHGTHVFNEQTWIDMKLMDE